MHTNHKAESVVLALGDAGEYGLVRVWDLRMGTEFLSCSF